MIFDWFFPHKKVDGQKDGCILVVGAPNRRKPPHGCEPCGGSVPKDDVEKACLCNAV
jgi:hypothetical protein